MEITEPVILDITQGRKKVRLELTTRADARDLIKAIARSMERLPDDGVHDTPADLVAKVAPIKQHAPRTRDGQLEAAELREQLVGMSEESLSYLLIHANGYCPAAVNSALRHERASRPASKPEPASPEAVDALLDAIVAGTPVVVDDEPDKVPAPIGLCGHPVTPGAWSQGFATCRDCLSDTTQNGVALYDRATAGEQLPTAAPSTPRPLRTVTLALVPGAARSDSDVIPALQVPCPEAHPTNGTLCEGKIPHPMPHRDPNGDEWSTEPLAGAL